MIEVYNHNANKSLLLCNHATVLQRRCYHDILRQCKSKTMNADIEIGNAEKYAANFIQGTHFVHQEC